MKILIKKVLIVLISIIFFANTYAEDINENSILIESTDIKIKEISENKFDYSINVLNIKGKDYEMNGCSVKKYGYSFNTNTKSQIIILCQLTGYNNGLLNLFTITKLNKKYEEEEIQSIKDINKKYGEFIKINYFSFDGFDYYLSTKTNKNKNIIIKNGYVIFSEEVNKIFLDSYSKKFSSKIIKKIDILIQKQSKEKLIKILNKLENLPFSIATSKKNKNIISYLKYKIKNEIYIKRPIIVEYKKTYTLFLNNKLIKKIDNTDYGLEKGIYTLNSKFKNVIIKKGILEFSIESYNYNNLTKNYYNNTKKYFYNIENNIFVK